jgi:hypothetical protein
VPGAIKISVFPPSFLLRSDLHVHPHLLNTTTAFLATSKEATGKVREGFPFSVAQLLRWAFAAPVEDGDVERLYALGQEVRVIVVGKASLCFSHFDWLI